MPRIRSALRTARGVLMTTAVVFLLLLAVWTGSEARDPGQQYPPALGACAFLAALFGPAFYIAGRTIAGMWRRK